MPRKNFILVVLGFQIPFDNNEISVKAMCNACPDQDRNPTPKKFSFKYATVGITSISLTLFSNPPITSMNGKPRPVRENNAISLLSKPALVCGCSFNTIYAVMCRQNTTNAWTTYT